VPWSVENIETYDILFHQVIIEKKRPTIPNDSSNLLLLNKIGNKTEIYKFLIELISKCWYHDQNERITFHQIIDLLLDKEKEIDFSDKLLINEFNDNNNKNNNIQIDQTLIVTSNKELEKTKNVDDFSKEDFIRIIDKNNDINKENLTNDDIQINNNEEINENIKVNDIKNNENVNLTNDDIQINNNEEINENIKVNIVENIEN
jgi:hypothetical protein